jgi:hypothetical protein
MFCPLQAFTVVHGASVRYENKLLKGKREQYHLFTGGFKLFFIKDFEKTR